MVNVPFSIAMRRFETAPRLQASYRTKSGGKELELQLHVADRASLRDAADLIAAFGDHAASEAAERARRSRDLDNLIHFCRWRQIERLILLLSAETPTGSIH